MRMRAELKYNEWVLVRARPDHGHPCLQAQPDGLKVELVSSMASEGVETLIPWELLEEFVEYWQTEMMGGTG